MKCTIAPAQEKLPGLGYHRMKVKTRALDEILSLTRKFFVGSKQLHGINSFI